MTKFISASKLVKLSAAAYVYRELKPDSIRSNYSCKKIARSKERGNRFADEKLNELGVNKLLREKRGMYPLGKNSNIAFCVDGIKESGRGYTFYEIKSFSYNYTIKKAPWLILNTFLQTRLYLDMAKYLEVNNEYFKTPKFLIEKGQVQQKVRPYPILGSKIVFADKSFNLDRCPRTDRIIHFYEDKAILILRILNSENPWNNFHLAQKWDEKYKYKIYSIFNNGDYTRISDTLKALKQTRLNLKSISE